MAFRVFSTQYSIQSDNCQPADDFLLVTLLSANMMARDKVVSSEF